MMTILNEFDGIINIDIDLKLNDGRYGCNEDVAAVSCKEWLGNVALSTTKWNIS